MKPRITRLILLGWLVTLWGAQGVLAQEVAQDPFVFDESWDESGPQVWDPFEPVNRTIFKFNDVAYHYVLTPIGRFYTKIMPDPFERGIKNFFHNLAYPIRVVNSLLQGKSNKALVETKSFLLNTTAGIGGFLKPSSEIQEWAVPEEDMKQTFGLWGIPNGPYLVVPIMGPSTARNLVGDVADSILLDPVNYINRFRSRMTFRGVEIINNLPQQTSLYAEMKDASFDPYTAYKDFYFQRVESEIEQ